jgi:curved DNA-binding protein
MGSSGFSSFFENLFGGGHFKGSKSGFGGNPFSGSQSGFSQQPRDTEASVCIDLYTALLGGDVIVTLNGDQKIKLKVKPCTQPGTKVRLRGKGQSGRDLIITYNVSLPTTLTERQKEYITKMRDNA